MNFSLAGISEYASGLDFFRNPDPGNSRSGLFILDLIEKSRRSRTSGDRDRDLKIPKEKSQNSETSK